MLHIEQKYLQLASPRLHRFRKKSATLFNFKCPFCENDRGRKARGYVYARESRLYYYCHRCGRSMGMSRFLREIDELLWLDFIKERLVENPGTGTADLPVNAFPPPRRIVRTNGLVAVRCLPERHPAVEYVRNRGIPDDRMNELYFTEDFYGWARLMIPEKYENAGRESRLVIPFLGADGEPVGFQGRTLGDSVVKYVSVVVKQDAAFIYGLERIHDGPVLATEGPIDAMFLDNTVATGGGDISREMTRTGIDPSRVIIIYDNEPRSPHTIRKMLVASDRGFGVCVWPESIKHKDINDCVMAGLSVNELRDVVVNSAKRGLFARAAIASWKRC